MDSQEHALNVTQTALLALQRTHAILVKMVSYSIKESVTNRVLKEHCNQDQIVLIAIQHAFHVLLQLTIVKRVDLATCYTITSVFWSVQKEHIGTIEDVMIV